MRKKVKWIAILGAIPVTVGVIVGVIQIINFIKRECDIFFKKPTVVLYQPSWTQGPDQGLFKVKFTVVNSYESPLWLNKMQFVEGPLMATEDPLYRKEDEIPTYKMFYRVDWRVEEFTDRIKIVSVKPSVPSPPPKHNIFAGPRLELGPKSQIDYELGVAVVPTRTSLEWWRFSGDYIKASIEIEYAKEDGRPRNKSFPVELRFPSNPVIKLGPESGAVSVPHDQGRK